MTDYSIIKNKKGIIVSVLSFIILITMTVIAIGMSSLVFYKQKISTNSMLSVQSYYAAEAGLEDALLRLKNNPQISAISYNLPVGNSSVSVAIPSIVGGSRTVSAQGNTVGIIKKAQVIYSIDSEGVAFNYGAQVGAGGLQMSNGSSVQGSVFSNGNISGSGTITIDAIVAGNGNSIKDALVQGNAKAYSCLSPAAIEGNLTYVIGGTRTCSVQGSISTQTNEILPQSMPISQSQIDEWKAEATAGGVINGNVVISNGQTQSIGPKKITGSLTISNNATLIMTGTVYVVGNIVTSNNTTIRLDNSYGSLGGIILSDGTISVSNGASFLGSGQPSSYLLVISSSSSNSAIQISNNATGAVFYTSNGGIIVSNNTTVKELSGYKITLSNNAVVQYESGLSNAFFSGGPSGGWKVSGWEEK